MASAEPMRLLPPQDRLPYPSRLTPRRARAGGVALGAALAGLAWGGIVERNLFTLRRVTVRALPPGATPFTVLHISDLHMAPWQHRKQAWLRGLAALHPDLIVDTGDNLGHREGLTGLRRALEAFRGTPGVYVNGSNDYFAPHPHNPLRYFTGPSRHSKTAERLDTASMERYFDDLGWVGLDNTAAGLDVRGTRVEFLGVDDPHRGFDRLELVVGALDQLREETAFDDDEEAERDLPAITIGVTHAPYRRVLNSFVTHGAQAIFAGHTHGGQICLPFFGALVTNCDLPRRQAKGLSLWRNGFRSAYLNVSAGVGTSIYAPVRFACRPEASLVTFEPGERTR
ncbi:MAG TPA: metallophosphoesterase [Microbacteriaceae bacterium]|nr:metallophosphoesterase [Microbacteriaceae bacterium]